ncbi:MAG: ligase-associated DNA damage response exonuclease [Lunatimonas sp.]|uniref:ligase-associated DNA damage response exonuclease n=1 Tax=Lunatimonas sp. TaxID=2060141 RepID=UPI002A3E0C1D|nr:ligase-associated DNA damage response exonuclease [Lunatimonas sp.]
MELLKNTDSGLFCELGNFFIDPWKPVKRAVITHAHSDHSRWGMSHYLAHEQSKSVMNLRLGKDISLDTVSYGQVISVQGVRVSFHPAGHIPGSSQIRLEYKGRVEVVSGDYKLAEDGLSEAFEPVGCHSFVSECTFGLPIYQWEDQQAVFAKINGWWAENAANGRCSVLFAYALGKAQRIIRHLDTSIGPTWVHGAIWNTNEALRADGLDLPVVEKVSDSTPKDAYRKALIIAPPSALGTPWLKRFAPFRTGIGSGWMNIRGAKRRRAADAGFVLSDHADWRGLNEAIAATGAEEVLLTHGFTDSYARYLCEQGINASVLATHFVGEATEPMDQ